MLCGNRITRALSIYKSTGRLIYKELEQFLYVLLEINRNKNIQRVEFTLCMLIQLHLAVVRIVSYIIVNIHANKYYDIPSSCVNFFNTDVYLQATG